MAHTTMSRRRAWRPLWGTRTAQLAAMGMRGALPPPDATARWNRQRRVWRNPAIQGSTAGGATASVQLPTYHAGSFQTDSSKRFSTLRVGTDTDYVELSAGALKVYTGGQLRVNLRGVDITAGLTAAFASTAVCDNNTPTSKLVLRT